MISNLERYSEVEINYNFSSKKANSQLVLEYLKDDQWFALNNHDYRYVLQSEQKYAAYAKISSTEAPKLKLRLHNSGSNTVKVNALSVQKRPSI